MTAAVHEALLWAFGVVSLLLGCFGLLIGWSERRQEGIGVVWFGAACCLAVALVELREAWGML